MNTKNILILVLAIVGAFLISAVVSFYLYPVIHPEVIKGKSGQVADAGNNKYINPEVRKLTSRIAGLQMHLDTLKQINSRQASAIDSLQNLLNSKAAKLVRLQKSIVTNKNQNIESTVKSLLNLDEDALSPIVNKLNYNQLLVLYKKASSMQREKLLKSLSPDKAAEILKKVMS